jgi:hypothetical protein
MSDLDRQLLHLYQEAQAAPLGHGSWEAIEAITDRAMDRGKATASDVSAVEAIINRSWERARRWPTARPV